MGMKYRIIYNDGEIQSESRNVRKHGQNLLGNESGGWIVAVDKSNNVLSEARYKPSCGWFNSLPHDNLGYYTGEWQK